MIPNIVFYITATITILSAVMVILTKDIFSYLSHYLAKQDVEAIVVGNPKTLSNKPAIISNKIESFTKKIQQKFH